MMTSNKLSDKVIRAKELFENVYMRTLLNLPSVSGVYKEFTIWKLDQAYNDLKKAIKEYDSNTTLDLDKEGAKRD